MDGRVIPAMREVKSFFFSLTEVDLKGQRKRTRLCVAVGG